jgi:hypothetical protein
MIEIPLWMIYFTISIIVTLSFVILFTKRSERAADKTTHFLNDIVKGLLLKLKLNDKQIYVARCYLEQSEDYYIKFEPDNNGITICLYTVREKSKDETNSLH